VPKKVTVKRLTFEVAVRHVLNQEGGVSNDPRDGGGLTNRGISSKFYQGLVKKYGYPNKPVTALSSAEITNIYKTWFWKPLARHHADNPALAIQLFDHSVNAGVTVASDLLNKGNNTPQMYRNARHTAYENDPNCATFCDGWHPRVERVYKKGLELS
jgi:lysozyme family protein